jgi:hypothetical protein
MEIIDPALGVPAEPVGESVPVARLGAPRSWPPEHVEALFHLTPGIFERAGCCGNRATYIWPDVPTFAVAFAVDEHLTVSDVVLETNGQRPTPEEIDRIRDGFAEALRRMGAVHERQAVIACRLEELGAFRAAEIVGRLQAILGLCPEDADAADVIERAALTLEDLTR